MGSEEFEPEEETPLEPDHNESQSDCFKRLEINNITTSGHIEDYVPGNMIDNNFSTIWRQQGNSSWISIHLNRQNDICRINIAWDNENLRPVPINFMIFVSANGDSFKHVWQREHFIFQPLFTRYDIQDNGSTASYVKNCIQQ